MLAEIWGEAGLLGKFGMVIAFMTAAFGGLYAARPTERRLALLRPLSLATVFASLSSFCVGLAIVAEGIAATGTGAAATWPVIVEGLSETFGGLFVCFGLLTIAWLCAAVGLRRSS